MLLLHLLPSLLHKLPCTFVDPHPHTSTRSLYCPHPCLASPLPCLALPHISLSCSCEQDQEMIKGEQEKRELPLLIHTLQVQTWKRRRREGVVVSDRECGGERWSQVFAHA